MIIDLLNGLPCSFRSQAVAAFRSIAIHIIGSTTGLGCIISILFLHCRSRNRIIFRCRRNANALDIIDDIPATQGNLCCISQIKGRIFAAPHLITIQINLNGRSLNENTNGHITVHVSREVKLSMSGPAIGTCPNVLTADPNLQNAAACQRMGADDELNASAVISGQMLSIDNRFQQEILAIIANDIRLIIGLINRIGCTAKVCIEQIVIICECLDAKHRNNNHKCK